MRKKVIVSFCIILCVAAIGTAAALLYPPFSSHLKELLALGNKPMQPDELMTYYEKQKEVINFKKP